jgi:hypothetical protein
MESTRDSWSGDCTSWLEGFCTVEGSDPEDSWFGSSQELASNFHNDKIQGSFNIFRTSELVQDSGPRLRYVSRRTLGFSSVFLGTQQKIF